MNLTNLNEAHYIPEACYVPKPRYVPKARYVESEMSKPTSYPDSGVTHHFTPSVQAISTPREYNRLSQVQLGNGSKIQIKHKVMIKLQMEPPLFSFVILFMFQP